MIRCLNTKILLFPLPPLEKSAGGIVYAENFQVASEFNQRFWVAAIGPDVVDLAIGDHVICPMPAEDHPRLDGGARVLDYKHVIAKLEKDP